MQILMNVWKRLRVATVCAITTGVDIIVAVTMVISCHEIIVPVKVGILLCYMLYYSRLVIKICKHKRRTEHISVMCRISGH